MKNKNLNLLGERYKLKFVSEEKMSKNNYSKNKYGSIFYDKNEIWILDNLSDKIRREVILHELGHFFAKYYLLENSETFAEAFAKYVLSILTQLTKAGEK
jgi:Zn-dependent peptidase ImmA (M78 family)